MGKRALNLFGRSDGHARATSSTSELEKLEPAEQTFLDGLVAKLAPSLANAFGKGEDLYFAIVNYPRELADDRSPLNDTDPVG